MKLEIVFDQERETKGSWRYSEREASPGVYHVGSLYVRKSAFGKDAPPKAIKIVVTEAK